MAARRHWYLLSYDIASPRRLQRIHRLLRQQGIPLQYSVFLLHCTLQDALGVMGTLDDMIDEHTDDIRLYPVSRQMDCVTMGAGQLGDGIAFEPVDEAQGVLVFEERHNADDGL